MFRSKPSLRSDLLVASFCLGVELVILIGEAAEHESSQRPSRKVGKQKVEGHQAGGHHADLIRAGLSGVAAPSIAEFEADSATVEREDGHQIDQSPEQVDVFKLKNCELDSVARATRYQVDCPGLLVVESGFQCQVKTKHDGKQSETGERSGKRDPDRSLARVAMTR